MKQDSSPVVLFGYLWSPTLRYHLDDYQHVRAVNGNELHRMTTNRADAASLTRKAAHD